MIFYLNESKNSKETWNAIPLKKVGKIKFGMSRDEVRNLLGEYKEFKKNKFSKSKTDNFGVCHIFYDSNGKCEAIEIFNDINVSINGKKVFPNNISALSSIASDFNGKISKEKSIGVEVDDNGNGKSITFGVAGYFD